jgi:hypothetical protein
VSIAELIRKMAKAGAPPEAIALAVEAIEGKDAEIDRRRQVERDRKRRQRAGQSQDNDGTVTGQYGDNPTPDKERSPTPPKEINPTPSLRSKTNRGARLPADWALPASWGQWAIGEGHSEASIRLEADKFRDFWHAKSGKDATKLDWEATWRNWMRNVAKPRDRPQSQAPPRETEHARHQREFREAIQQKLKGNPGHDEFASTGPAFDLEPGDYNAH